MPSPAVNRARAAAGKAPATPPQRIGAFGKWALRLILLVTFFYVAYRYPFQIGDGELSPTYSATPIWLQIGKFLILSMLLPVAWWTLRKDNRVITIEQIILVFSMLTIFLCMVYATADFGMASQLFEIGFFPLFALAVANPSALDSIERIFGRMLKYFFWLNIGAYIVQLGLFLTVGRLPSLAFGGATTRFGGMWDDPNSALAPFALYVPYYLVKRGFDRHGMVLLLLTLISIVLSQSGTSLAATVVGLPILFIFFSRRWSPKTRRRVMFAGIFALLFTALAFLWSAITESFDFAALYLELDETLRMKSESISLRADSYSLLSDMTFGTLVGLDPLFDTGENQFVNIIVNFGAIILFLFVAVHIMILYCLYSWTRNAESREDYAMAVGCSCYFIWYFVSMANIPKAEVFPVNLLAALVAGLAIAARKRYGGTRRRAPNQRPMRGTAGGPALT